MQKLGNEFNILFTSAGRRVSLIRSFRSALDAIGLTGKLVAADMRNSAPAAFVADLQEEVPQVSDATYVLRLQEICRRHDIKLLVPLIDTELHLLAPHRAEFAQMGVTLLVSSGEACEICHDKRKTGEFFRSIGIKTPATLDPGTILADPHANYPFLLKPATGSCSVGVNKINNPAELEFFMKYVSDPIVQELVGGQEYTLDILVDFAGKVRSVVPRLRMETRAGEVSKGLTVKNQAIIEAGRLVAASLPGAIGCITAQCFLTADQEIVFFEINPRFGGGVPLSIEAGADFPRWIIEMMLHTYQERPIDDWRDNLAMLRYDEGIFVSGDLVW